MLHLFKKTYIQIDSLIDVKNDRLVISKSVGMPDGTKVSIGEVLHHVDDITKIVGKGKEYESVFSLLKTISQQNDTNDRPFVIYADQSAFLTIVCAWFKAIFANIDSVSAHKIIKAHFDREKLVGSLETKDFDAFDTFEPSLAEWEAVFGKTTVTVAEATDILTTVGYNLSIEFLLSSYVYNKTQKAKLKVAIQKLVKRQIEQTIIEAKYTVNRKLLRKQFTDRLGVTLNTFDNIDAYSTDPALKIINDSSFMSHIGTPRFGKQSNIDLKSISDADIVLLDSFINKVYPELEYKEYFQSYLKYVRKTELTDADLDAFIANECVAEEPFCSTIDLENINIYFIDYVLQNVKSPEKLKAYLIR
jgi:hypothetical protein